MHGVEALYKQMTNSDQRKCILVMTMNLMARFCVSKTIESSKYTINATTKEAHMLKDIKVLIKGNINKGNLQDLTNYLNIVYLVCCVLQHNII